MSKLQFQLHSLPSLLSSSSSLSSSSPSLNPFPNHSFSPFNTSKSKPCTLRYTRSDLFDHNTFASTSLSTASSVGTLRPRAFAGYSIYKGKTAFTLTPKPPEMVPLSSGAFKISREGYVLLQFAPANGTRRYDWNTKQVFSLSVGEMGNVGARESSELFHDPFKGKSEDQSHTPETRSWFGPSGQYIKELPCPSCRGRGYTPCTECGIERSRPDCPKCYGKGILTCQQCSGDCVIWEESIDEQPWERARSISPLKVMEDDEVDKLDIKLDVKKKSKRVYQSPPPEVGLKISRSLKSLNAKTGLFSNRMKIIHQDPKLQAQRVAAIKKAKGTAAARKHASKTMKAFFSDPINRQKRSMSMKGVKFYCRNCGREGHRRHNCPELKDSQIDRRYKCRLCGKKGHNKKTCGKLRTSHSNEKVVDHHRCKICRQYGHNRRTCPLVVPNKRKDMASRKAYKCRLCRKEGHNLRTCPSRVVTEHPQD